MPQGQPHELGGESCTPYESTGLGSKEVEARKKQYGANILPRPPHPSLWRLLLSQVVHFFALMLWVAGALAILAGMPQLGYAIFVVIILNGLFAFFQEYRAEKAADLLRDLLPRRVTVIRDGTRQNIDAIGLVPGDLVVLKAGDRISADIRLAKVDSLSIDSSMLTGESVPATPQIGEAVFAGTFAVEGEAIGSVAATGNSTRLAQIAKIVTAGRRPRSPLARELDLVTRTIALVSV
ncbi:MAG TPA: HAD-IC family P-type ATPase, partial [Candidatus Acidoferrum sp.]